MNSKKIRLLGRRFRYSIAAAILLTKVLILPSLAHHQPVHETIAKAAVDSSDGLSHFADDVLGGQDTLLMLKPSEFDDTAFLSPRDWVGKGAYNQDYWPRWGNHFYTVKPNRVAGFANGLTDGGKITKIGLRNTTNSYVWATLKDIPTPTWHVPNFLRPHDPVLGGVHAKNAYRWEDARDKQYQALTEPTKSTREERMAYVFYSLGHIIHLNQDVSQPDHSRDDQHASRPYIEDYGGSSYEDNPDWFKPKPRGWGYWRDQAGFKRLRDFWDRDRFKGGSASALVAEATGAPAQKLGLAEFSNGNFLGEDALYAENFWNTNDTHYFPFPSLADTDQSQLKAGGWWSYMAPSILADGTQAPRPFLKKIGAGVHVEHHSVLKYLGAMNMGKIGSLPGPSAISIDAPEVLKDYHDILVPKAVEYSAGILDYFFRGRIDASTPVWSAAGPAHYTLTVRNLSGEPFKDGEFTLWSDDATSGNRTQVGPAFALSGNFSGGIFAADASQQITFESSQITDPERFVLVYKGNIGLTDGNPSDPVDQNIAIAAKVISNSWHSSFETTANVLLSSGSRLPDGWLIDFGNIENFNLAAGVAHEFTGLIDLDGLDPGGISVDIPTIPGQSYTLSLAFARNPDSQGQTPGYPEVSPEAEVTVDGHVLNLAPTSNNSWSSLDWQTLSYSFNAAGSSVHLKIESLDEDIPDDGISTGVLLDAVDLRPD